MEIKNLSDIKSNFTESGYVIAYLDNKILIGKYEDEQFKFYQKEEIKFEFIQKIRIFNKTKELYCWRSKNILKGRLKDDENSEYIDANQVITGTKGEKLQNGEFIKLSEESGTEVILPNDKNFEVNEKTKRVAIKTRNYIGYSDNFQATYVDTRFVEFVQLPEKEGE